MWSGRRLARVVHFRTVVITFPSAPRRTVLAPFSAHGSPVLQCLFTSPLLACHGFAMHEAGLRLFAAHGASGMDVSVTSSADDHRFALSGGHQHHPLGLWLPSFYLEVFQGADVMHLTLLMSTTVLTRIRQEPLF